MCVLILINCTALFLLVLASHTSYTVSYYTMAHYTVIPCINYNYIHQWCLECARAREIKRVTLNCYAITLLLYYFITLYYAEYFSTKIRLYIFFFYEI